MYYSLPMTVLSRLILVRIEENLCGTKLPAMAQLVRCDESDTRLNEICSVSLSHRLADRLVG